MSAKGQIAGEITRILSDWLLVEAAADTDLIESGAVDSVGVVSLLVEIEQRFGISLPIDELTIDDIRSIGAIGETIARALKESAEELSAPALLG